MNIQLARIELATLIVRRSRQSHSANDAIDLSRRRCTKCLPILGMGDPSGAAANVGLPAKKMLSIMGGRV